jgi:hypothetical protein
MQGVKMEMEEARKQICVWGFGKQTDMWGCEKTFSAIKQMCVGL